MSKRIALCGVSPLPWYLPLIFCVALGAAPPAGEQGVDPTFDPSLGSNGVVNAILVLPDGQIMVGGHFTNVRTNRQAESLLRLKNDGSLDAKFPSPNGFGIDDDTLFGSGAINALLRQPDGKVLVGGSNTLFRLTETGDRDRTFANSFLSDFLRGPGSGSVQALALQTNGAGIRILAVFSGSLATPSRTHLVSFHSNGAMDATFKAGINDAVLERLPLSLLVDSVGRILVGGKPSAGNGGSALVRLNADGSRDPGFNSKIAPNSVVRAMALRPDGYVLVGGSREGLAFIDLVRPNGELDASFTNLFVAGSAGSAVMAILPSPDGRAVLGGDFANYGGLGSNGLVGILTDGTPDPYPTFDARGGVWRGSMTGTVRVLARDTNSSLVVAGDFDKIGDTSRQGIACLFAANQPPQAEMVSPTNREVFVDNFTIPLVAKARDDRGVSNVLFQVMAGSVILAGTNGVRSERGFDEFIGQVPAGLLVGGSYTVQASATDSNGLACTSAPVTFAVEMNPAKSSFPRHRAPDAEFGGITVQITNAPSGGRWRLEWEPFWRANGASSTNLPPGNYWVAFQPVTNCGAPTNLLVTVVAGTNLTYDYEYPPGPSATGELSVEIQPAGGVPANLLDAVWVLDGLDLTNKGNATLSDLPVGTYVVKFFDTKEWKAPNPKLVTISSGQGALLSVVYERVESPPVKPDDPHYPHPLQSSDFDMASDSDPTYSVNGQVRSDTGVGSGVAVRDCVVLTAAHLVYFPTNEFSFPGCVRWYPGRMHPDREPRPLYARGVCFLTNYAKEKARDPPGTTLYSGPLDVAALWFSEPVARRGYAGYLVSQSNPSEWLTNSHRTTLVGYPVGGTTNVKAGWMHATPRKTNSFQPLVVGDGRLYRTDDFVSFPGNSGGAVYAEYVIEDESTNWFPAGIYLGESTTNSSRVRVIDTNVLQLINMAASLAYSGGNYSGGGVDRVDYGTTSGSLEKLTVKFTQPAVAAAAGWCATYLTNRNCGVNDTKLDLYAPYKYTVAFSYVAGFLPMPDFRVEMFDGQSTILKVSYEPEGFFVEDHALYATTKSSQRARLQFRPDLVEGDWTNCPWDEAGGGTFQTGPNRVKVLKSAEGTNHPGFYRLRFVK
jgi:uncharacterized delta-60 repeat protein